VASSASATTAVVSPPPAATPAATPSPGPTREIAGAQQVWVTYKGAELAPPTVTRDKAAARKRAEEALSKIKKENLAFEEAVKLYTDDERARSVGGATGNFERGAMPAPFSKATFDLKVGEISDVVETSRGFHVIKRLR
jgi:hypothetical protein